MQSRLLQEWVLCLQPAKTNNAENLIFAELLSCIVNCINNIDMYFSHANTVKTIAGLGMLFPSNKMKMLNHLFFLQTCSFGTFNNNLSWSCKASA